MAHFVLSAFADEADKTLDGQLAALKRNKIRMVELRGVEGHPFVDCRVPEAREIKEKLDDAGVSVGAIGSPFGKIGIQDPFAPHLEQLKHSLELCAVMNCDMVRMFSFYLPDEDDPADWRQAVIDRLGKMLEAAEEAGVLLAHENEKGIYGDTAARCLDLLEVFEGRLGCVFDPANFLQCGVETVAALDSLLPYMTWMHIKDVRADGTLTPAGQGAGRIAQLLKMADGACPHGVMLTVEPHLALFSGYSALEQAPAKKEFLYDDTQTAFDAACHGLAAVLRGIGFKPGVVGKDGKGDLPAWVKE